jgi:hypothetical protein
MAEAKPNLDLDAEAEADADAAIRRGWLIADKKARKLIAIETVRKRSFQWCTIRKDSI